MLSASLDPILDSEKRSTVQQRLFSVFDREESKNRQRQRLNRFKKNEREDMSRANMIGTGTRFSNCKLGNNAEPNFK